MYDGSVESCSCCGGGVKVRGYICTSLYWSDPHIGTQPVMLNEGNLGTNIALVSP